LRKPQTVKPPPNLPIYPTTRTNDSTSRTETPSVRSDLFSPHSGSSSQYEPRIPITQPYEDPELKKI
jgi:hypothetical protein